MSDRAYAHIKMDSEINTKERQSVLLLTAILRCDDWVETCNRLSLHRLDVSVDSYIRIYAC